MYATDSSSGFSCLCLHLCFVLYFSPCTSLCVSNSLSYRFLPLLSFPTPSPVYVSCVSVCVHERAHHTQQWQILLGIPAFTVSSYANPFYNRHTNMRTHNPLIHLSSCLNGDEHFVWPGSLLHLFPPSTLSCSPTERQETIEKTKGSENDGRLLPDILRTEIKEDIVGGLLFGLFSAEIHRVSL